MVLQSAQPQPSPGSEQPRFFGGRTSGFFRVLGPGVIYFGFV